MACRHLPGGSDEQDVGRNTRGGISPRGLSEGVSVFLSTFISLVVVIYIYIYIYIRGVFDFLNLSVLFRLFIIFSFILLPTLK